jgi:hypothetical protein
METRVLQNKVTNRENFNEKIYENHQDFIAASLCFCVFIGEMQ